jgi:hypothetical protein
VTNPLRSPRGSSRLEQIETQISSLSDEELARFRQWFAEFDADAWDRQIERDLAEGKLDDVIAEAEEDLKRGRTRPL